jgi:hypothetical protein
VSCLARALLSPLAASLCFRSIFLSPVCRLVSRFMLSTQAYLRITEPLNGAQLYGRRRVHLTDDAVVAPS